MNKTNTKKKNLNRALVLITSLFIMFPVIGCTQNNNDKQSAKGTGGSNAGTYSGTGNSANQEADGNHVKNGKIYTIDKVSFIMKNITEVKDGKLGDDSKDNNKQHTVNLSAYLIGETEVTQDLWTKVMEENPSFFNNSGMQEMYGSKYDTAPAKDENQASRPVEQITWYQAIAFCNELTKKISDLGEAECVYYTKEGTVYTKEHAQKDQEPEMKMDKKGFRLPTEAEWEWAAKGGTEDKWAGTNVKEELVKYAWYDENSIKRTHEVKKKLPNGYGLYDMSGNVYEWCWDRYDGITPKGEQKDPTGPQKGDDRVQRGGSWIGSIDPTSYLECAYRNSKEPDSNTFGLGLRIVCRP